LATVPWGLVGLQNKDKRAALFEQRGPQAEEQAAMREQSEKAEKWAVFEEDSRNCVF